MPAGVMEHPQRVVEVAANDAQAGDVVPAVAEQEVGAADAERDQPGDRVAARPAEPHGKVSEKGNQRRDNTRVSLLRHDGPRTYHTGQQRKVKRLALNDARVVHEMRGVGHEIRQREPAAQEYPRVVREPFFQAPARDQKRGANGIARRDSCPRSGMLRRPRHGKHHCNCQNPNADNRHQLGAQREFPVSLGLGRRGGLRRYGRHDWSWRWRLLYRRFGHRFSHRRRRSARRRWEWRWQRWRRGGNRRRHRLGYGCGYGYWCSA